MITLNLLILYKNITIYFNYIEFGPIYDDFSHIPLKLVILYENITICSINIKFCSISVDFSHITLKLVTFYKTLPSILTRSSLVEINSEFY